MRDIAERCLESVSRSSINRFAAEIRDDAAVHSGGGFMDVRRSGGVRHSADRDDEIKLVGPDIVEHDSVAGPGRTRRRIFLRLVDGSSKLHNLGTGAYNEGADCAREDN